MFSIKKITVLVLLAFGATAHAQTQTLEFENGPKASLEFPNGPTASLDLEELKSIKDYAFDANTAITRLLNQVNRLEENPSGSDADASSIVNMKKKLMDGITDLIKTSKDKRSLLLLTHSLQAGVILVKLIEKEAIEAGPGQAPQGIVGKQFNILKQSLVFARNYYLSDFAFIDGVIKKQEQITNPKFVEFGVELTQFAIKMSNGITNVHASYGMVRWSLAVLANYIRNDKNTGIAYASTQYNLITSLTQKNMDGSAEFPDLVNGETAPSDIACIMKTRDLKFLAKTSFEEIDSAKAALSK